MLLNVEIPFNWFQLIIAALAGLVFIFLAFLFKRRQEKQKSLPLRREQIIGVDVRKKHLPDYSVAAWVTASGFIMILVAIFCLIGAHYANHNGYEMLFASLYFSYHMMRDLGIGLFSGGVIAIILELRDIVEKTKRAVFAVLKTDLWLEEMTSNDLEDTRNKIRRLLLTKQNFRQQDVNVNSLIVLEDKLRKELFVPYYEKYRMEINCEEVYLDEMAEFEDCGIPSKTMCLKKKILTRFTVINPTNFITKETLAISIILDCPIFLREEDAAKLCTISAFSVKSDGNAFKSIENEAKYLVSKNFKKDPYPSSYDTQFTLTDKAGNPISFEYSNSFSIEYEELRYVLIDDYLYRRRLIKPSRFTELMYTYETHKNSSHGVILTGDCITTSLSTSDRIKIREGVKRVDGKRDQISIEVDDWLLPGNGLFVLHCLK